MGKFDNAEKIGLREKGTEKLFAVYPGKVEGTDEEIDKKVRDWYYMQGCANEDNLRNAYVDVLTEQEIKQHK